MVPAATMAQRLVRAKTNPSSAHSVSRAGSRGAAERLDAALAVVYLIFNEGYAASSGTALVRAELSSEAIRLGA